MMRVADYVWKRLTERGVRDVFMVSGGGAMHLNDALARNGSIRYICNHHEQGSAIGAEGYARVTGAPGVISVTSGPGGVNALNGVYGCWMDSIPMIAISGQIRCATCKTTAGVPAMRQLGDQEADIVGLARVITKYAVIVDDPQDIRYHLDRAWHLATTGRPGPCWLDIPLDVQSSQIDETTLREYDPSEDAPAWDASALPGICRDIIARLRAASRPVILAGSGVRLAGAISLLEKVLDKLGAPVVLSRTGMDLVPYESPWYCGRGGIDADRAGNFTVQNADVLLVLASRLNTRQIGHNGKLYARGAFKIHVDIDALELRKPTIAVDLSVHADVRAFLEEMNRQLDAKPLDARRHQDWLAWCKERLAKYPAVRPEQRKASGPLNPYHFLENLFGLFRDDEIVAMGNGAAFIMTAHVAKVRKGQRWFFNSGCASMGYDLPASLGAAVGSGRRVICMAGDGSFQMNIQELQTLVQHRFPVKVFILNNGGYLSIRTTQKTFFKVFIGEGPESGVTFPDMVKIAEAYGIPALRVESLADLPKVKEMLDAPGPALVDVIVDPAQSFEPRLASRSLADGRIISPPIEDMFPFLSREELKENMKVPLVDESR